jgi:hypothetical protein
VIELTSCAEFRFNNIDPFIIRPVIFTVDVPILAHLRAHVLLNNLYLHFSLSHSVLLVQKINSVAFIAVFASGKCKECGQN